MSSHSEAQQVSLRSYGEATLTHTHLWHQLVIPISGLAELEVDGHGDRLLGRRGALVPAGERHAIQGFGQNEFLILDLDRDSANATAGFAEWVDRRGSRTFFDMSPAVARVVLTAAVQLKQQLSDSLRRAWFSVVAESLADESLNRARSRSPAPVTRAMEFMAAHPHTRASIRQIAAAAGVSESYLHLLFRKTTGESPRAYAARTRDERAYEMVVGTDRPLSSIALDCGFSDQASFTKAFRSRYEVSPGVLRRSRFRDKGS